MIKKKRILLLSGGPSKERKVSIQSGSAVCKALNSLGYEVIKIDPTYKFTNFKKFNCSLAFNALHGQFGEDGTIQKYLEKQKISYTHSGVKASALAMNKIKSKKQFIKQGIKTPKYKIIKKISDLENQISNSKFVLKPINEGSSVGVLIFDNLKKINKLQIKKYKKNIKNFFKKNLLKERRFR